MSEQLGSAVTVDCPPVVYSRPPTARSSAPRRACCCSDRAVEVTIRNAKVVDWEIIDTQPGA